jgi:hypothetical protein
MKRSQESLKLSSRKLFFETLEQRQMLAGGALPLAIHAPVPEPYLCVSNNRVPVLDILPGATNKLVADMSLSVRPGTNQYGRLDEMMFLSAVGSEPLSQNTAQFTLKNGSTVIGIGSADPQTDLLDIDVNTATWVRPNMVTHVQLYANFASWGFTGTTFGVTPVFAGFMDLRGSPVIDTNVSYAGVSPILHTLENSMFNVSQNPMLPYGSVNAGDKNVTFLKFNAWTTNASADSMTFVTSAGNLGDASNYVLLYTPNSYNGIPSTTTSIPGTVVNNKLVFNFAPSMAVSDGSYELHGDVSATPAAKILQLEFQTFGTPITAHNVVTGKALKGISVSNPNGSSSTNPDGQQIQLYFNASYSTDYNIVTKPAELVINEIGSQQEWTNTQTANAGDNIVVDTFTMSATSNLTLVNMAVTAVNGNLSNCSNYTLWADLDGDGKVDTMLAKGALMNVINATGPQGMQIVFNNLSTTTGYNTAPVLAKNSGVLFEVHADVPNPLSGYNIQCQLASPSCVTAFSWSDNSVLTTDKIFESDAWQTDWNFSENNGASISDLMAEIAQLQAQLLTLQNGGGGLG